MVSTSKAKRNMATLFFVLLVIENSGYMLQVSAGKAQLFIQYSTILLFIILAVYHFILKNRLRYSGHNQNIFLIFATITLLSTIANGESINSYLNMIAIIFIAFFIVETFDLNVIANVFVNTMVVISLISLAFMIWISMFGIPDTPSMISTTASENQCYNYIVFFYPKLWSLELGRNRGVFWEPGLFASFLIIALMLEAMFSEHISKFKIIILTVTVFSTLSTAGILLLFPTMILYIDRFLDKSNKKVILLYALWIIFIFLFVFKDQVINNLVAINSDVFGKLLGENNSKVTRLGAPLLNWKIFISHPFFGAGMNGATSLFQQNKLLFLADSQTSTSLYMMASLGFFGVLYTFWWIRSIVGQKNFGLTKKIAILFIVLIILNKEPHSAILATWLLLFLFEKMRLSLVSL